MTHEVIRGGISPSPSPSYPYPLPHICACVCAHVCTHIYAWKKSWLCLLPDPSNFCNEGRAGLIYLYQATLKPRRRSFGESTNPTTPPPSPSTANRIPVRPPFNTPESRRRRAMGELQAHRSAAETRLGPNRINSQPAQVEGPLLQTHTGCLTHTHTSTSTHARTQASTSRVAHGARCNFARLMYHWRKKCWDETSM